MNRKELLYDQLEDLAAELAADLIEGLLDDKHRRDKPTDEDVDFVLDMIVALKQNNQKLAAKAYKSIAGPATRKKVSIIFTALGFPVPGAVYDNPTSKRPSAKRRALVKKMRAEIRRRVSGRK